MCRKRSAFTLVEVLIVLVIIGIAAAVIVPQMSSRDDLKAAAGARVVMSDLMYAQNLAITRQTYHYLVFDITNQRYSVVTSASMTTPIAHPVSKSPYTVVFGANGSPGVKNMSIDAASFKGGGASAYATIGFDELGTPMVRTGSGPDEPLSSGSISIRSGSHRLQISVEPYTGQLTVAQVPYP